MKTEELNDKQLEVVELYKELISEIKELPTYRHFLSRGISRDMIRARFGGIENLHEVVKEYCEDFLSEHVTTLETVFSPEKDLMNSKSKKRYIVTTAVANSGVHRGFIQAMRNYASRKNAQIVIMPCESITNSFENKSGTFDASLNAEDILFVQRDTPLNDNISLCSIQVSAKQIRPITGLSRIGNREGSYVFASPKQFLEYVPAGNKRGQNYSIMTPGACTLPEYYSERFVSKRLSYIAEYDHKMGAIIIEIESDKIFHFRHIQCDETDGSFVDLGTKYLSDGTTENVDVNVIFGDLHGNSVDEEALQNFLNLFSKMSVLNVFLHDVFDGYSISHHVKDIVEKSLRSLSGDDSLKDELVDTYALIRLIDSYLKPKKVNIVKSNHDEFLTRYLQSGGYVNDPKNHYTSLKIATALFESGEDVLKRGFEIATGNEMPKNWHFLSREDTITISDVECAAHGDLGLNGSKPSLSTLEKAYGNCVVGHSHSAAIQRGVFRVGTLSKLNLGYNRGPSSWTHTCCLLYENGQRQLINSINGRCSLEGVF
jgi:hypothetical protein